MVLRLYSQVLIDSAHAKCFFSVMIYGKYVHIQSKINYTLVRLNVSVLVKIGSGEYFIYDFFLWV